MKRRTNWGSRSMMEAIDAVRNGSATPREIVDQLLEESTIQREGDRCPDGYEVNPGNRNQCIQSGGLMRGRDRRDRKLTHIAQKRKKIAWLFGTAGQAKANPDGLAAKAYNRLSKVKSNYIANVGAKALGGQAGLDHMRGLRKSALEKERR